MKEFKLEPIIIKKNKKSNRPKTRGFGYQVLGFGSGGGAAPVSMDYLIVAGGAGSTSVAGAGAGGFRTSFPGGTQLEFENGTPYTVTVGSGGGSDAKGQNSTFQYGTSQSILASGGGLGNEPTTSPSVPDKDGGSGGGGSSAPGSNPGGEGGQGNVGGFSPPEGNDGANGAHFPAVMGGINGGGGGGGANEAGTKTALPVGPNSAKGGDGSPSTINGSDVTRAGGGGAGMSGGPNGGAPGGGGIGGAGGGGGGNQGPMAGQSGQANTGGGAGGGGDGGHSAATGGSGVVIFRAPSATTLTVSPGDNQTSTAPGGEKIATFTVSGTITAE